MHYPPSTYAFGISLGAHVQGGTRANTLFPEKMNWGEKERSILSSNHLDQRGINFIRFFYLG